jgi:hypothetical protein
MDDRWVTMSAELLESLPPHGAKSGVSKHMEKPAFAATSSSPGAAIGAAVGNDLCLDPALLGSMPGSCHANKSKADSHGE